MSGPRYKLVNIAIAANVRGVEMRKLLWLAQPSEPFGVDEDGKPVPHAEGSIQELVTVEYASGFELGQVYSLQRHHVTSDT